MSTYCCSPNNKLKKTSRLTVRFQIIWCVVSTCPWLPLGDNCCQRQKPVASACKCTDSWLGLFSLTCCPFTYSSVRKLVKLSAVQFMLNNHTVSTVTSWDFKKKKRSVIFLKCATSMQHFIVLPKAIYTPFVSLNWLRSLSLSFFFKIWILIQDLPVAYKKSN